MRALLIPTATLAHVEACSVADPARLDHRLNQRAIAELHTFHAAVTDVAAVWRSGQLEGLTDCLFDDEQHAHERNHEQRRSGDPHHNDGRHQAKRSQRTPEPRKANPPYRFTSVCCVRVHDVQHYLRMPGLCCTASDGLM